MLNLRKKLLVSIFTLMLALVAVSTTTYAWFTLGTEVKVSNISMEVEGTDGLMFRVVSINGKDDTTTVPASLSTFTSSLNFDGVAALAKVALEPLSYDEVSGEYGLRPLVVENDKYDSHGVAVGTTSGKYIHIEFEFYSASDSYVYLSYLKADSEKTNHSFTTPVAINETAGLKSHDGLVDYTAISKVNVSGPVTKARLANALRIAYKGYTPTSVAAGVITYADSAAHMSTPSSNIISPTVYDMSEEQYGAFGGAAQDFFDASSDTKLVTKTEYTYGLNKSHKGAEYYSGAEDTEYQYLVSLLGNEDDGYYGRVTLTIWLEGWDADAFNAVIEDSAFVNVSFKAARKPAAQA